MENSLETIQNIICSHVSIFVLVAHNSFGVSSKESDDTNAIEMLSSEEGMLCCKPLLLKNTLFI